MNQEEFLQQLAAALAPLNDMERGRALDYYREMIADETESGKSEQEVIAGLGSVQDIAAQILAENGTGGPNNAAGCNPHYGYAGSDGASQVFNAAAEMFNGVAEACSSVAREVASSETFQRAVKSAETVCDSVCDEVRNSIDHAPCAPCTGAPDMAEAVTFTPKEAVRSLIVDAHNINLEVRSAPVDTIQIHLTRTESDIINVSEAGGVYSFMHKTTMSLFGLTDLLRGPRWIVVDVPAGFAGDIQAGTRNGRLAAHDLSNLATVQLSTSNGTFQACNIGCTRFGARTSNGGLTLDALRCESCIAETSNARIQASNCLADSALHLYTSNGKIQIDRIAAGDIELSTQNAPIKGTILGDMREYAIHSRTSNASNTLPPELVFPGQVKQLNAHTRNGNIRIDFIPGGVQ